MTTALFLRPPSAGGVHAEWLELATDGSTLASGQLQWPEDLAQLATQAAGKKLTVLLPVSSSLVTQVQVPAKQRKHLNQVLPFLLEDQLAGSVDDLHVIAGAALADDYQQVVAIEHAQLRALLDLLKSHGLHPDEVSIDALLLPVSADQLTVLLLGDDALIRLRDGGAQQISTADLPMLLPLLATEATVQLYSADSAISLGHDDGKLSVQREEIDHALAWLARRAQSGVLSLLQGPYAQRTAWNAHWQQWRKVAFIAGLAITAQYAYAITDWVLLKQRVNAIDVAIRDSFTQAFPEQANTPLPINSMNGYIKQLGSGGAGGFTSLLAEIGPVLQQTDGISLRGLGFEASSSEMRLDISARDLSALNQLDSRLQQMGFRTDMGQASASSGGYSARVVLHRQSKGATP